MKFDTILKNCKIYDGSGNKPYISDIGISGDIIAKIGDLSAYMADTIIDAEQMSVAPGFINMLSWSVESLLTDGRAMSVIKQGVTLEVMGEGLSWGPVNDKLRYLLKEEFSTKSNYEVTWNTLGEYLQLLENKGVSVNICSFVGATTIRIYVIGEENRSPTTEEIRKMQSLVDQAMKEGAMGLSSALIYAPATYAKTDELIKLCEPVAKYDGMYISHIRSEGSNFEQAVDEFLKIAETANIRSEIYHFKAAGKRNWYKLDIAINKINEAIKNGLKISTDCYLYRAAGTGLDSCIPPWALSGGRSELIKRLKNNSIREKIKNEMENESSDWENLYVEAGSENIVVVSFKNEKLNKFAGKSISEISKMLGKDPKDVIIDLLIEDESRIGTIYFIMDENNIRKKIKLPHMSFGSDAAAIAPEGEFLETLVHPRTYGNFSKLISRYVVNENVISLEEAIYKLTKLPATNLKIEKRGEIKEGYFADIVIFDPNKIKDKATYLNPHQLSEGMSHVLVNGTIVLLNGEHTGAFPGKFIKGPGYAK